MFRLLFIFILFFIIIKIDAQVPGMMGKRFSFHYDFNVMKNANYFSENDRFHEAEKMDLSAFGHFIYSFSSRHDFELDYISGKYRTVGLAFHHFKTGWDNRHDEIFSNNIRSNGYGLYLKKFRATKGSLAPLGHYLKFKWMLHVNRLQREARRDIPGELFPLPEHRLFSQVFSLSMGKQTVIKNHILLNFGVDFGLQTIFRSSDPAVKVIQKEVSQRLFNHSLVQIKMGVGWVAF